MSWQSKPVGELFRVVNGGTPKTGVSAYWDGPHKWITPAEMGGLPSPHLAESRRTLTDEGLRVGAELVPANSIILSSRAPIGHLVINDVPMAFNQGCKGLVPSGEVDSKFAFYFFLANIDLLESLGTGTTFKELSGGKLKEVSFHYPPFAEQRRIVSLLDEAFAGIAIAKANAKKSLRDAGKVFDTEARRLFSNPAWPSRRIGDVFTLQRGLDLPTQERISGKFSLVSSSGVIDTHDEGPVNAPGVVTGRSGSIGNVFYLDEPFWPLNTTLYVRDFKGNDPRFIYHLIVSLDLRRFSGGTGVPTLNRNDVHAAFASVPESKEVQSRIAAKLDALRTEVSHLQRLATCKLATLDRLKQSLLHQAFSGQL